MVLKRRAVIAKQILPDPEELELMTRRASMDDLDTWMVDACLDTWMVDAYLGLARQGVRHAMLEQGGADSLKLDQGLGITAVEHAADVSHVHASDPAFERAPIDPQSSRGLGEIPSADREHVTHVRVDKGLDRQRLRQRIHRPPA